MQTEPFSTELLSPGRKRYRRDTEALLPRQEEQQKENFSFLPVKQLRPSPPWRSRTKAKASKRVSNKRRRRSPSSSSSSSRSSSSWESKSERCSNNYNGSNKTHISTLPFCQGGRA
uniref:Capsid protein n=1 Tax=Torque teno virus 1 TaxID=687340 RepID=A0A3S8RKJ6_9VIRU|nr:hypothetical protein ORF3 [Torque teno virus 1]